MKRLLLSSMLMLGLISVASAQTSKKKLNTRLEQKKVMTTEAEKVAAAKKMESNNNSANKATLSRGLAQPGKLHKD